MVNKRVVDEGVVNEGVVNEIFQRADALITRGLQAIKSGDADNVDLRRVLEITKTIVVKVKASQTAAAARIAAAENHGDGGAGLLSRSAGLSQRNARGQIKTAEAIKTMPTVRDAVENGKVTFANAKHLTDAGGKTSPRAVQSDTELLRMAETLPPEQFGRQARKWAARHQQDNGEAAYQRLRARRALRIWNSDDGMVHIKGEFDPVTGERIRNRLTKHAARLHKHDKQNTHTGGSHTGGSHTGGSRIRHSNTRGPRAGNPRARKPSCRGFPCR